MVNGVGALCLAAMCLTGAVIWWPGGTNWRRSLSIDFTRQWKRVNWDVHSAVGFWTVVFIAMWAVTGVYFAFPSGFRGAIWWTGHAGMHRACLSLGSSHHLTTRPRSW